MTINRTTLLDLPLPVTGTESGTWGDTTNNGLTQYMDIAIAGMSNLTSANFTAGAVTIETTEGTSSATNIVATSAQYAGFRVTSLAQNSTITVGNTGTSPARSYRLINADATYSLTFKATGQTGVTLLPGQSAVVAFNGTDYVIVGMVGAGTATDNAVVRFDGTTGKLVQNSVVTIADSTGDVAGVGALTMGGNLTLSGGTANGVLYLNGSKVATSGSALTFDGTTLTAANFTDSSLTSGRVTYATTGGNLTDSANLLYSGTDLTVYGITVGRGAGAVSTNTAVGASALASGSQTGTKNTAVGQNSLIANTSGSNNVSIGTDSLPANTTGGSNVSAGVGAMYANTTGSSNTAYGHNALQANTTASNNTAVGYQAGYSNTTGTRLTAVGWSAGRLSTGDYNTFIGSYSGYGHTSGSFNTAVGDYAMGVSTITGIKNTAIGQAAMSSLTSGANNTALGVNTLTSTANGSNNTALGMESLYSSNSNNNTAVGYQAGYSNTTGTNNAFFGAYAGYAVTTGQYNTFVGRGDSRSAGDSMTTGSKNTILGGYTGNQGGLDIRTANNYIVLSDGDGNPRLIGDGSGNWVAGGTSTSTRFSAIGTPTITALSASIPNDPNGQSAATLTIGANTNGGVWAGGGYGLRIIDKTSNSGSSQTGYGLYVSAPYDGTNASGNAYALIKYGIYVDDIYSFYGINAATNTTNWGLFVKGGAYNHMANPLLLGTTTPVSGGGKLQVSDGITFPATQSASSNANTLDDYEEGTWTPTLIGSTSTSGQSYTHQRGRYTKIGNLVTATFDVQLSDRGTLSGTAQIDGLPFSSTTSPFNYKGLASIGYWASLNTNYVFVSITAPDGSSSLIIRANTAASGNILDPVATDFFTNNTRLIGGVTYMVS